MDKISESLNAATAIEYPKFLDEERKEITNTANKYQEELSTNLAADYNFVRNNLRTLITGAMNIIPNALALAGEAENAQLYESTGSFIKTVANINKDLLNITERNLKPIQEKHIDNQIDNKPTTINNNAIFVGTTDDLFNQILLANKIVDQEKEFITQ